MVILDESESILQQLNSGLSQFESLNFTLFEQLVRSAGQLICIDAFLSQRTVDVVCNIRESATDKRLAILNDWQRKTRYHFFVGQKSQNEWCRQLIEQLKAGKNIVVPCNVAGASKAIHGMIAAQMPELLDQICVYTQDTNVQQKIRDLSDL